MSKDILTLACDMTQVENYVWSLYFYRIDRRAKNQPYTFNKVRFKNADYLLSYVKSLMSCVTRFQISGVSSVQEYDGENTKISCDKINLKNGLISTQWENFVTALGAASDEIIKGKINGYVVVGVSRTDPKKTISFIKAANPITTLANRRTVVFTTTAENELEMFSDSVCRLYLSTDIMVIGKTMYTYNHNFESLFDIEKTMVKIKTTAINQILSTKAFAGPDLFASFAHQYNSNRTFITLKEDRIMRIKKRETRVSIAKMLKIDLDASDRFIIDSREKATLLIKYLCFRIFKDGETDNLLEASAINPITV